MKKIMFVILSAAFLLPVFLGAQEAEKKKKPTYRERLENRVHELVNKERIKRDLPPFKNSKALAKIALAHSVDMIKRGFTSHINPDGLGPSDRAKAAGFNIEKKMNEYRIRVGVGENIFAGQTVEMVNGVKKGYLKNAGSLAEDIVAGWMASPPHRKNILDPTYTMAGTGVAVSKKRVVKATQVFF